MGEAAHDRVALDDATVVLDVAAGGDLVELALALQDVADSDKVGRDTLLVELEDSFVNGAIAIAVEVLTLEEICYLYDGFGIDDDTPENTTLCLDVLW